MLFDDRLPRYAIRTCAVACCAIMALAYFVRADGEYWSQDPDTGKEVRHQVTITTISGSGNLKVEQDPTKKSLTISATIVPSDHTISWVLPDELKNVATTVWTGSAGSSTLTITLDTSRPGWDSWYDDLKDSKVVAEDAGDPAVSDSAKVDALKFRRNDSTAFGSSRIDVNTDPKSYYDSIKNGELSGTSSAYHGWKNSGGYGLSPMAYAPEYQDFGFLGVGEYPNADSSEFSIYYQDDTDRCGGKYSIRQQFNFDGDTGDVVSEFCGSGAAGVSVKAVFLDYFHWADVNVAAAVTAGVDGAAAGGWTIPNQVGMGYTGAPPSVSLGISASGSGVGGSIGVGLTIKGSCSLLQQSYNTAGSYFLTVTDQAHLPTQELTSAGAIKRMFTLAADGRVEQRNYHEWNMFAFGELYIKDDFDHVTVSFSPNM